MKKKNFLVILIIVACLITVSKTQILAQEQVYTPSELPEWWEKFEKKCPDVITSFQNLQATIMSQEGKLSIKEKEFIALGIAVSKRCEPCITYHTAAAMKSGATEEEILEAASVAIYMGGGPAFSNIKHVINALEALSDMKESKNAEK